ncbi:MAG: hypothetical protein NTW29_03550 [Bacteroidetes bacterium]|nr:hypothetical protein [Bacteroidota bacterium]
MKKSTLLLFSCLTFIVASAQKIVFQDDFNTKNLTAKSVGEARIIEDSVTLEKILVYSGKKELLFYWVDPKWKLISKISVSNRETNFRDDAFKIFRMSHTKSKWAFILRTVYGYTRETVDFTAQTLTIDEKYADDKAKNYMEELFIDGNDKYVMYLNKNKEVAITSFLPDFTAKSVTLQLNSELPVGKTKKYSAEELYNQVKTIDSISVTSAYFTRNKVHLYVQPDKYAILVANDEPVTELSYYDKKTGRKLKSQIYSLADKLPGGAGDKNLNTAALLYGNYVYLLAAYKAGGVFGVFDRESKKLVYHYVYNEKDKSVPFSYGPVTYETLPGTISTSVLKEKVEDISMDKFCTEMFKHSCAITARYQKEGMILISLANYDMKELAAATSTLRTGLNTMSSALWYVSTSAGFIFEPGSQQPSVKKTSWSEVNNNTTAGDSYKKVEKPDAPDSPAAEFNQRGSFVIKRQYIGNRRYVVYYVDRMIKVDERVLKNPVPSIVGAYD